MTPALTRRDRIEYLRAELAAERAAERAERARRDRAAAMRLFIAGIISVVAEVYGLRRGDLTGPSRQRIHVIPRWIAMGLARSMTDASLPVIGRHFGGRDHTSVLHGLRRIEQRRQEEPDLDRDYRALEALCLEDTAAVLDRPRASAA